MQCGSKTCRMLNCHLFILKCVAVSASLPVLLKELTEIDSCCWHWWQTNVLVCQQWVAEPHWKQSQRSLLSESPTTWRCDRPRVPACLSSVLNLNEWRKMNGQILNKRPASLSSCGRVFPSSHILVPSSSSAPQHQEDHQFVLLLFNISFCWYWSCWRTKCPFRTLPLQFLTLLLNPGSAESLSVWPSVFIFFLYNCFSLPLNSDGWWSGLVASRWRSRCNA